MDKSHTLRSLMTGIGALASLSVFYWLAYSKFAGLPDHVNVFVHMALMVFFGTFLAIIPRITLLPALAYAGAHALAVSVLVFTATQRFIETTQWASSGYPLVAVLILFCLPVPFFIAHSFGTWRNYAVLFEQSWQIVLRHVMGLILVLTVWLLITLSDLLLSLVGLGFSKLVWDIEPFPYVISGAAFGFGMAVAAESIGTAGARLALMLLRPLLPIILGVVTLFLIALPFRGLSSLFGALSAGMTLLAISAVAATMVTAVVGAQNESASRSPILALSARIMAGLMLVLGGLAVVAVIQRVLQYGWTPERIYAAMGAGVSLCYGLIYASVALRPDWMARIRRGNVTMALVLIGIAALLLTPVLNAERISTADQMARFSDGRTAVEKLDVRAIQSWGIAGRAALDDLAAQSKQPGQEQLAAHLQDSLSSVKARAEKMLLDLRNEVIAQIPLQPPSAREAQALLLQRLDQLALSRIKAACARKTGDLAKSCAMIVADFLPSLSGEEGVIAMIEAGEQMRFMGLTQDSEDDNWADVQVLGSLGNLIGDPAGAKAVAILREWQLAAPMLTPAPIMQIPLSEGGVILQPRQW